MFAVGDILVADEVLDAPFSCNLGACHGGCCVQGDSGAPLEPDERAELEKILPRVRHFLRPEALDVIEEEGVWEEVDPQRYATTCVDAAECVFVTYEGPIAKCAIEKAYFEGLISFRKPISCHLFPLRAEKFGYVEALNYEQIPLCSPAIKSGRQKNITLFKFLREPLVRKYGEAWYEQFRQACEERREALGMHRG
jgi:Fe-S-cluster containining protein